MDTIWTWLLQPLDPTRPHEIAPLVYWHARLMTLAWGILAPLAVLMARYFKILPGQDWPAVLDSPVWWRIHWKGQLVVAALAALAFGLVLWAGEAAPPAPLHRLLGYGVLGLLAVQLCSGLLRGTKGGPTHPAADGTWRGDHYDMTRRRLLFEALHKTSGHVVLLLAAAAILLGLWAVNAPRWMWIVIVGWWMALLVGAVLLQIFRGAPDTYQAIWGPDPAHPGNRIAKRGVGTFRPGDRR